MEEKRIDSKLILFTLVLVLITLLLLNHFLEGKSSDEIWDYDNITTAEDIINLGERVEDRDTYYILEEIVTNYLYSYNQLYNENTDTEQASLSYEDYYKYLNPLYKKHLNKSEYNEVAKKFLEKFCVYSESEVEISDYMDVYKVIRNIYSFDGDVYLCECRSDFINKTGYFAVKLQTRDNSYNIMYIE